MADIGSTLREARMRARIDIGEVETRTKIRAKYLRAIENEEWDLLPGPVYAKSFLRTYGDFLGLDSRMLVDEFKRRYEHPNDHEARSVTTRARDRERRPGRAPMPSWVPIGAVVLVVVALLFVVGLAARRFGRERAPDTSSPSRRAAPGRGGACACGSGDRRPLQLVPTGTVYVCLVNGRGKKLINEQTFTSGQPIPTETARRLLLTLGNASVSMKVNGRPVTVAPSPNAIRLLVTATGTRPIPLSQTPTCP